MTPELTKFFADLPPHIKPANDTERLKMTFAWLEGQTVGMRLIANTMNAEIGRIVPALEYDLDDIDDSRRYEPDAKSASDSINRENAAAINRDNKRETR